MSQTFPLLGIYGGTFDPIHLGHTQPVSEAAELVGVEQVKVIPCHIPPHKATPSVSSASRLEMVRLAFSDNALFEIDDRELKRDKHSYSVDTLTELREQYPQHALCFFMGTDAIKQFTAWHRWQDILELTHLVVCARHVDVDMALLPDSLTHRQVQSPEALKRKQAGLIWFAPTTLITVSSTTLRQAIRQNRNTQQWLSAPVADYINTHQLYRD